VEHIRKSGVYAAFKIRGRGRTAKDAVRGVGFRKSKAARFKSDCKHFFLYPPGYRFELLISLKIGGAYARTPKIAAVNFTSFANFKPNAPRDFNLCCPEGKRQPSTTPIQNHTPPPPTPALDFRRGRELVFLEALPRCSLAAQPENPGIANHLAASKSMPGCKRRKDNPVIRFAIVPARTNARSKRLNFFPSFLGEKNFLEKGQQYENKHDVA